MGNRTGIEVSLAISEAVKQANVDLIAAYPITPQTHIVEHLSEIVADGELDAEFVPVESEHSAMSVCCGTAAVGARTFTATSSQGLALMSEIVYIAASLRFPIVMVMANRSLSGPLSIWGDHSDVMSVRDSGWIQVFVENGQEAYDHVFWAFRVAEDRNVILPVIVNVDGFILTHMVEPIEFLDQQVVDRYLPVYEPLHRLHPDNPTTMGAFGMPEIFTEAKKAQNEALIVSKATLLKGWEEFKKLTGRAYAPVETYRADDAETLLVAMGSFCETATTGVDMMRDKGKSVGLVKIRLWRPFPFEELHSALGKAKLVVVMDRAISFGGPGGPVASEVKAALYHQARRPRVVNFIAGLASRDLSPEDFENMVEEGTNRARKRTGDDYIMYGVRE